MNRVGFVCLIVLITVCSKLKLCKRCRYIWYFVAIRSCYRKILLFSPSLVLSVTCYCCLTPRFAVLLKCCHRFLVSLLPAESGLNNIAQDNIADFSTPGTVPSRELTGATRSTIFTCRSTTSFLKQRKDDFNPKVALGKSSQAARSTSLDLPPSLGKLR